MRRLLLSVSAVALLVAAPAAAQYAGGISNPAGLAPTKNLSDVASPSAALANLGGLSSSAAASTYAPLASPVLTGSPTVPGYETIAQAALLAPLASPVFTGSPTVPGYETTAAAALLAPLASPVFTGSPTVPGYAPLASPVFTGSPTVPGYETTAAAALLAPLGSPVFTGSPVVPGYETTAAAALLAPLASPVFTGSPTVPGYETTALAAALAPLASPNFTGAATFVFMGPVGYNIWLCSANNNNLYLSTSSTTCNEGGSIVGANFTVTGSSVMSSASSVMDWDYDTTLGRNAAGVLQVGTGNTNNALGSLIATNLTASATLQGATVASTGSITAAGTISGMSYVAGTVFRATGSTPSASGSCPINTQSGKQTGSFFTLNGACSGGTITLTFTQSMSYGYACWMNDETSGTPMGQSGHAVNSVTFKVTGASGDAMNWGCLGV